MKALYLQIPNHQLSVLFAFFVLIGMSSCNNSKYTASFQKVPSKNYSHAQVKVQENASSNQETKSSEQYVAQAAENDLKVEIPEDLTASLKELGISEKKTAKLQKSLEKLNQAVSGTKANPSDDAREMNFAEKLLVKKALKKADKIVADKEMVDIKDLDETNKVQQRRSNIILGLILLLAGILVAALVPAPGVLIGSIVAAVGLILLIIGLINSI